MMFGEPVAEKMIQVVHVMGRMSVSCLTVAWSFMHFEVPPELSDGCDGWFLNSRVDSQFLWSNAFLFASSLGLYKKCSASPGPSLALQAEVADNKRLSRHGRTGGVISIMSGRYPDQMWMLFLMSKRVFESGKSSSRKMVQSIRGMSHVGIFLKWRGRLFIPHSIAQLISSSFFVCFQVRKRQTDWRFSSNEICWVDKYIRVFWA